jgi:hypothetical protein
MSGRHVGQSATRKRVVYVAAVSAVAIPFGVVAAGSASALTLPGVPVDNSGVSNSSVSNLGLPNTGVSGFLGNAGSTDPVVAVLGESAPLGGITGAVTSVLAGNNATSGVTDHVTSVVNEDAMPKAADNMAPGASDPVTALLNNTPVAKVLGKQASAPSHRKAPSHNPASDTGNPVALVGKALADSPVGHLNRSLPSLPGSGGAPHAGKPIEGLGGIGDVVSGLGLGATITGVTDGVTGALHGALDPILGAAGLGGTTLGGLLGGSINTDVPTEAEPVGFSPEDGSEPSELPHTGADSTLTALLLCSGLGLAGAGATLVGRHRRRTGF